MLDFLGEGGMEDSLEKDDLTDISDMSQVLLFRHLRLRLLVIRNILEDEGH